MNRQVLLKTTFGDIDVELWSKEMPLACRNFVQLCLEGYYNGCMFHRIVRGNTVAACAHKHAVICAIHIHMAVCKHACKRRSICATCTTCTCILYPTDFIAQTGDPTNTGEGKFMCT